MKIETKNEDRKYDYLIIRCPMSCKHKQKDFDLSFFFFRFATEKLSDDQTFFILFIHFLFIVRAENLLNSTNAEKKKQKKKWNENWRCCATQSQKLNSQIVWCHWRAFLFVLMRHYGHRWAVKDLWPSHKFNRNVRVVWFNLRFDSVSVCSIFFLWPKIWLFPFPSFQSNSSARSFFFRFLILQ